MTDSITLRKFGPKPDDHPSIGKPCTTCKQPFKAGDYTTLIALGPGDDLEAQDTAASGGFYNAIAVEVRLENARDETTL